MRFCFLLAFVSLAVLAQDSSNAVAGPLDFYRGQKPVPRLMMPSPYAEFLKRPAKPVTPFAKYKLIEPAQGANFRKCGHIVTFKPRQLGLMKILPLSKEANQMPKVKSLPACPNDLR